MTGLTWEALEPALRHGQPPGRVVALLRGATEQERRSCSKAVMASVRDWFTSRQGYASENLLAAALGCGPEGGLRRLRRELRWLCDGDGAIGAQVLIDRAPPWLPGLAAALLGDDQAGDAFRVWPLVRRLVRAGVIERPDTPAYAGGMVRALIDLRHYWSAWQPRFPAPPYVPGPTAAEQLRADPELLGPDLDGLFTSEPAARALTSLRDERDGVTSGWLAGLLALAADGAVARDRLLDGILTALAQDWASTTTARWYLRLWARLEPVVDELDARQERLLRLLSVPLPTAVGLALKELERLDRTGRLDQPGFVDAAEAPLLRPERDPAMATLRVLDRCLVASPALADAALAQIALALTHDRVDVRDRALRLLTRRRDRAGERARAALADALEGVSPTLREAVATLLGADPDAAAVAVAAAEADAADAEELAMLAARATGVPGPLAARLGLPAALAAYRAGRLPEPLPPGAVGGPGRPVDPPPADPDELVDLFLRLIQESTGSLDLERAMAATVRLGRASPETAARAQALLDAARRVPGGERPFTGTGRQADAAGLAMTWLLGRWGHRDRPHPDLDPVGPRRLLLEHPWFSARQQARESAYPPWQLAPTMRIDLFGFVSGRVWEAADRTSRGLGGELLALPTHDRGGIDPRVLAERVARAEAGAEAGGHRPGRLDLAQALLRIAGWDERDRAEARTLARSLSSPAGAALRRALGDPDAPVPGDPVLRRAAGWAAGDWAATVALLRPVAGTPAKAAWKGTYHPTPGPALLFGLPPSGLPVRLDDPVTLLADLCDPLGTCDQRMDRIIYSYSPQPDELVSPLALVCPAALDLVVAHGLPYLNRALDSGAQAAPGVLEPLLHPEAPLGPAALAGIALGTGASDARLRALTADLLVQAAADGRLDGAALGARLGELFTAVGLRAGRVAETLGGAATASPIASARVADCLAAAVPVALGKAARDCHKLTGLLAELLAAHGRAADDPVLRSAAESASAGGKRSRRAVEAARLLSLPARAHDQARAEAARQGVEALLARAGAAP